MALQKREKQLAIAAGALVAVMAAIYLWPSGGASLSGLRALRDKRLLEIAGKNRILAKSQRAKAQIAAWEKRALPSDPKLAGPLYQTWLRELVVERVKFRNANVDPIGAPSRRGSYYELLKYKVGGDADWEQLTRFLHEFYRAGHLHKIQHLQIRPKEKSSALNLTIDIEALSLPGLDRRDRLSAEPGDRLRLSSLAEYEKPIAGRKLFAAYTPPAPERPPKIHKEPPPKPPEFDPASQTYLTAVIETDGQSEAWLQIRTSGKTLHLHEGEEFTVGPNKYKTLKIHRRSVEIEDGGKPRVVRYGDSLKPDLSRKED
ncbi:MAG: hypothetical protein JXB10_13190 [Pirellulales bacterium]|nr:hypothetical protein [Pirellulales bacterium]